MSAPKHLQILLCFAFGGLLGTVAMAADPLPRVISLSPSLTETVCQIGREKCLVGRSSVCNYPESVKKLPVAGAFGGPGVEATLKLQPALLIITDLKDPSAKKVLENAGVKVLILPTDSIADYFSAVDTLGRELSAQQAAKDEIKRIKQALDKNRQKYARQAAKQKPKVFLEIWDKPLMTIGNASYLQEWIEYAGGTNLGQDQAQGYFKCSPEWVITSGPDVIICPSMKKNRIPEILRRPGWEGIPAIKNKRVYADFNSDLVFRLGPRMLEGIDLIHRCLYPVSEKETP